MSVCIVGSGQLSGGLLFLCLKEMHCLKKEGVRYTDGQKREKRHLKCSCFSIFCFVWEVSSGISAWVVLTEIWCSLALCFQTTKSSKQFIHHHPWRAPPKERNALVSVSFFYCFFLSFSSCFQNASLKSTLWMMALWRLALGIRQARWDTQDLFISSLSVLICAGKNIFWFQPLFGGHFKTFSRSEKITSSHVSRWRWQKYAQHFLFSFASTQIFLLFTVKTSGLSGFGFKGKPRTMSCHAFLQHMCWQTVRSLYDIKRIQAFVSYDY